MDWNLIVGLVAFAFALVFYIGCLLVSEGAGTNWPTAKWKPNAFHRLVWKLTGHTQAFLIVNFMVAVLVLGLFGGWLYIHAPVISGLAFGALLALAILGFPKKAPTL